MKSFENETGMRAHAELMHAIQSHQGKVSGRQFDPELVETRSAGQVYADAQLFVQMINLTAEFGTPAAIVSFLIYARPILIKWLELKKGRSIEIKQGDLSLKICGSIDIDEALKTFNKLKTENNNKHEK